LRIQQLRCVHEVATNGLSVTAAAATLHATQPGVSAQIRLLEDELGLLIFERRGKRIVAVTEPGRAVVQLAAQILHGAENLKRVSDDFTQEQSGVLRIATTHTQARYALPRVVLEFKQRFPDVQLSIHQGSPTQICEMVVNGDADFAIATEAIGDYRELVMLPCYRWNRCVVTPPDHPLLLVEPLTLDTIASYPIVTYDFAFSGRSVINKAFSRAGLEPNVVLTAIDSDVIKTYVELGLGIGLLAKMAFDPERDTHLRARDASHLFEDSVTRIGFRKGAYLRKFMFVFLELFSPQLTVRTVRAAAESA